MDGVGSAPTSASTCLEQPLVLRKSRGNIHDLNTVPGHAQAVLVGNGGYDNSLDILSLAAAAMNASTSFARTTTAMRSCDSEMASSVPSRPSYFFGTAFRSMSRPSASSPMATENTTRAEVVAAADHAGDIAVTEQTLNLALLRRIAPSVPQHRRSSWT